MQTIHRDLRHWRDARRATLALLVAWGVVTFGATFFARELGFPFLGFPFGYWVAAQGALLVYVVLIALYAWVMDRLDLAAANMPDT